MRISIFYPTARIKKSRSARKDKCVGHNITSLPPHFYSALKLKVSLRIKIPGVLYKREFQYFVSNLQVARTDFLRYSEDVFGHVHGRVIAWARANVEPWIKMLFA